MKVKSTIQKKTGKFDLTILIPTYNEEDSVGKLIKEIRKSLRNFKCKYCILISDNYSTDNTIKIVNKEKNILLNRCKKKGYGSNLINAINKINSKYTIFFDADGSYDPKHVKILYNEIKKSKFDLVTYNRLRVQEKNSMPFLNKYLGTPVLSFLIRIIYGIQVYDCNAGMRIFNSEKMKKLELKCTGMEFASEILIKLSIYNLKYKELTLKFRRDYRNAPPHLNPWRDGVRHLIHIIFNIHKSRRFKFFQYNNLK